MADTTTHTERHRLVDREFQNIRELLELLMTEMSMGGKKLKAGPPLAWAPPTDVYETESELVVVVEIAGMDIQGISIAADDHMITIRGVRKEISPRCRKQFHKMEVQVGPFQRSIQVPVPIEPQSVTTTYANGLLEVRLRRKPEPRGKRTIEVE